MMTTINPRESLMMFVMPELKLEIVSKALWVCLFVK